MYTAPISVLQGNTIACATRLPVTSLSTSLPSFPSAHLLGIVQLQHRLPLAGMLKGANLHDRLGRALVVPAAATKATATSAKATAATTKATATTAATATAKATTRGACMHAVWVCETVARAPAGRATQYSGSKHSPAEPCMTAVGRSSEQLTRTTRSRNNPNASLSSTHIPLPNPPLPLAGARIVLGSCAVDCFAARHWCAPPRLNVGLP